MIREIIPGRQQRVWIHLAVCGGTLIGKCAARVRGHRLRRHGYNAAFLSSRELVFTSSRPVKTRSIHVVSS